MRCPKRSQAFSQCEWVHLRESLLSGAVERLEGSRSFPRSDVDVTTGIWITESRVEISLGAHPGYAIPRGISDLQPRGLPSPARTERRTCHDTTRGRYPVRGRFRAAAQKICDRGWSRSTQAIGSPARICSHELRQKKN